MNTKRNTCPLCGSKRDGRNLSTPCPQPHCRLTHAEATDRLIAAMVRGLPGTRYAVTLGAADIIRALGYRFDSSWRHASDGYKAETYARCFTIAANDIADNPELTDFLAANWFPDDVKITA